MNIRLRRISNNNPVNVQYIGHGDINSGYQSEFIIDGKSYVNIFEHGLEPVNSKTRYLSDKKFLERKGYLLIMENLEDNIEYRLGVIAGFLDGLPFVPKPVLESFHIVARALCVSDDDE